MEALRKRVGVVVLAVLAMVAVAGGAWGQQTDESAMEPEAAAQEPGDQAAEEEEAAGEEAAEPGERETVLDTIYVTAQKRTEDVQDVPLSITTFDAADLELISAGGADVRFLSARVPSLLLESSFGRAFPRFYIRGLGNTDFDLNASQPVSMVYDEVVLENPVLKGMPVWDVERTEVLRGPQGTLFGRNTPAGIVKFESVKPSQEFDAFGRLSYGTYGTSELAGAVGGALTPALSARASVLVQSQDDWIDNGFTGERDALGGYDTWAYRLQFLWQPSETFSGLLNLHGWDVDGTARVFRANVLQPGTNDLVPGYRQDRVSIDGRNSQDIEAQGGVLKLDWQLDGGTLTSVTAYETLEMFSRGDIDGGFGASFAPPFGPGFIPFYSETADGLPELDQLTQELRFATESDGPLNGLVGAFWFDEDLVAETYSFNSLAGGALEGFSVQRQQAESWAVFGSLDYQATERWNLKAGLRFTHDEKDFSAERPQPVFQTPTFAPITRSTEADLTSWDLAALYALSPTTNVYGRVATSFRAPSVQGRILFCPDFEGGLNPATNCVSVADEEEILSGEIGFKSDLLERRLRLGTTVYLYEVDGQQVVAVGGQFNTATLLNTDATEGYGFETDLEVVPNEHWRVKLGASYNSTEIQDPGLAVAPCGGGCTVLDPIGPNGALVDGNSLPHAPEWILNGILDYRTALGDGLVAASLDAYWYDEKSFFLYESEEFRADGFELGARIGYLWRNYELALFGRNLTDEVIVRNGIDFNNLTGMMNEPRIVGLELVTRF
jgi:iron complex outermembrane receptor protein